MSMLTAITVWVIFAVTPNNQMLKVKFETETNCRIYFLKTQITANPRDVQFYPCAEETPKEGELPK